jgi:hypothetical protein
MTSHPQPRNSVAYSDNEKQPFPPFDPNCFSPDDVPPYPLSVLPQTHAMKRRTRLQRPLFIVLLFILVIFVAYLRLCADTSASPRAQSQLQAQLHKGKGSMGDARIVPPGANWFTAADRNKNMEKTLTNKEIEDARWAALSEDEQLSQSIAVLTTQSSTSPFPPTHQPVEFDDITLLADLSPQFVPKPIDVSRTGSAESAGSASYRRLIVIGDIHGMKTELLALLKKVNFDPKTDHLICAGDMISKGPDSVGVVKLLMDLGADAVRGNHEDRILLAWQRMHSRTRAQVPVTVADSTVSSDGADPDALDTELAATDSFSHSGEYKDRLLAKKFSSKQIEWLKHRPVIMRVGAVEGLGEVVVVHAGLVPGVRLERQDPSAVMNMRTIDGRTGVPSEGRDGVAWTKVCAVVPHCLFHPPPIFFRDFGIPYYSFLYPAIHLSSFPLSLLQPHSRITLL